MIENPETFDLSLQSRQKEFDNLIANPEWVSRTVQWYVKNLLQMREQGGSYADFYGASLTGVYFFPLEESLLKSTSDLTVSSILSKKIAAVLNHSPHLCLNTPEVPGFPQETVLDKDDPMSLAFGIEPSSKTLNQILDERAEIEKNNKNQASQLKTTLGLSDDEVTYEALSHISSVMKYLEADLRKVLFFRYILDMAADSIRAIAPRLSTTLDTTVSKVLLVSANGHDRVGQVTIKVGELHGISVQTDGNHTLLNTNFGFWIYSMGHELMHAVVTELLAMPTHTPGFSNKDSSAELAPRDSLLGVILEGVSLAFESEFVTAVQTTTPETLSLQGLNDRLPRRVEGLIRSTRQFLTERRKDKAVSTSAQESTPPRSTFSYSEGARLAKALKKKGWTLNDLNELLEKISDLVGSMNHSNNESPAKTMQKIAISSESSSPYQNIISEIKLLVPNSK